MAPTDANPACAAHSGVLCPPSWEDSSHLDAQTLETESRGTFLSATVCAIMSMSEAVQSEEDEKAFDSDSGGLESKQFTAATPI